MHTRIDSCSFGDVKSTSAPSYSTTSTLPASRLEFHFCWALADLGFSR